MLKKSAVRRIMITSISLLLLLLIYKIPSDPITNSTIIYEPLKEIPVYLKGPNNYVSRINVTTNTDDINYLIELLTINGKYHLIIPDGFKAVIPENTQLIDYHIKDKTITLNFSKEFLNVTLENEETLIESLIYSLCEYHDIQNIIILVNGEKLTKLPHSQKELPELLNYEYGINKTYSLDSLKDTEQITVYYLGKYQDYNYYIPITKITNNHSSKVEVIVNELKTTPYINANISSYLKASYELEQYEILENSIKLTFNNNILANLNDNNIEEEIKYILTLSIRDSYNIQDITIDIN